MPGRGEEGGQSKTMAETQKEAAQAKASAEAKENEGKDVLRVVTDKLLFTPDQPSAPGLAKKALSEIAEHFGGTPNGLQVELEVLPGLDENYDAELTQLRVELMAGNGPDVFLMSGFGGNVLRELSTGPVNTLFMNPEAAMKRGQFLALDEYIENARFMDMDKLLPAVMDAGKYDGRQYIMPMEYSLPEGAVRSQVDKASLPANWDEGINSDIDDVRWSYAIGLRNFPGFRSVVFQRAWDNLNETMLIDKDEFFQRTKEACDLYSSYKQNAPAGYQNCGQGGAEVWGASWLWDVNSSGLVSDEVEQPFFILRNSERGLSAGVETWCAVNANTEHPEDAFFMVDIFLSKEYLSTDVFWETRNFVTEIPVLGSHSAAAIPVYSELLTIKFGGYMTDGFTLLGDKQRAALAEAQESITYAYLTSNIDREIDSMFSGLAGRIDSGETISDEDLRKTTDKCHSTLEMMLAES